MVVKYMFGIIGGVCLGEDVCYNIEEVLIRILQAYKRKNAAGDSNAKCRRC